MSNTTETPCVVNVKKAALSSRGIDSFQEWLNKPRSLYIGRDMTHYIHGAHGSKWQNKFPVKKFGLEKCLELYEESLRSNQNLMDSIQELAGMELGCWCKPGLCHGDILVKVFQEFHLKN